MRARMRKAPRVNQSARSIMTVPILLMAAAGCLAVEGCGNSSPSTPSAPASAPSSTGSAAAAAGGDCASAPWTTPCPTIAAAAAAVKAAEAPTTWKAPGPPFDVAKVKGKTVWFIAVKQSIPFLQLLIKGFSQGITAAGGKPVVFDGAGTVSTQARGIETAIAQHASAIELGGVSPVAVSAQLADAKAAGIPVITTQSHDPGAVPADQANIPAVKGSVSHCGACGAKMMADYAIVDTKGQLDAVVYYPGDIPDTSAPSVEAIKTEVAKICPKTCKVKYENVPVADWATRLPTITSTDLTKDPNINYLLPAFDGMVISVLPAVHAANAQGKVKIASFNASSAPMQYMKNRDVVTADVGSVAIWQGWAFADQALRILSGNPPADNDAPPPAIPERLFDVGNIDAIYASTKGLKNLELTGYGNVDFVSKFKQLWGLG
jgi:ribose transport system substrate-binding protein